jgi:hypothetical protein
MLIYNLHFNHSHNEIVIKYNKDDKREEASYNTIFNDLL